MAPAISVAGLTCRFGSITAVDDLTLEIGAGEVFALLGHNGAGKTTTIRLLNGLLEPSAGHARVFDLSPLDDGPALRCKTAVLTETPTLDERLTARETLEVFAALFGVAEREVAPRVEALLGEFGLDGRGDDRVGSFSKGMKQRLALARALVHEPELLYLDEPTAGLDPAATRQLHERVRQWSREQRRTVVLCTHNLVEAQELCDRVAVLARGRLLALGTVAELIRRIAPSVELLLEVDPEHSERAIRVLGEQGVPAAPVRAGTVVVSQASRERVPEIVARLVAGGVHIYRLEPREPSLADVYFALQRSAHDESAP
ncbi:MAG: ABC transporter ATP-binding protein [Gemmatimonadaceae bacterium]